MAAPGGAADPSMEDILASIRRILNEDEVAPASPNPDAAAAEAHAPPVVTEQPNAGGSGGDGDDGVLVLDEAMLVTPVPPASPVLIPEPPAALPEELPDLVPNLVDDDGGLLAPEAAAAASSSVGALLRSISQERSSQVYRGGPTIEDLVREEIRPLLKAWLDQHLPPMVERLVRQEIERVTGRAL